MWTLPPKEQSSSFRRGTSHVPSYRRHCSRIGRWQYRDTETRNSSRSRSMAICQAFWDAGVPKEALQVIITDREALKELTTASAIKHIILTGGTDTAQSIARTNPSTPLSAETGGKNAIILNSLGRP